MSEPRKNPEEVLDERPSPSTLTLDMVSKVLSALAVIVAGVVASYAIPGLDWARPWTPEDPVPFWNLVGRPFEAQERAEAEKRFAEVEDFAREALAEPDPDPVAQPDREVVELDEGDRLPPYVPRPGDDKPTKQPIELFQGDELDHFFESLAYTDAAVAGSTTRVIHWGDSVIGLDGIPGAIRRRMQARFGDAGHGFHLMSRPNTSYLHREVDFETNGSWYLCFIIRRCKKDGRYGLGGATSYSNGGAESSFAPDPKHSSGRVSRFELWYLAQPRGGKITLRVDGGDPLVVDTRAEQLEDRWELLEVPDGMHELSVRASGGGQARTYGVTLERSVPGLVWDSAALVGAFTNRLAAFDEDHLRAQLEHRGSQLAVFMFGGNDMIRERMSQAQYEREYREVIGLVKRAAPDIDCLIIAPLDHGERQGGRIVSREIVPEMVATQRRVAEAEGCAFFNTYEAMGGEGSAARWYRQSPRLISGDLGHLTRKGHKVMGEMFYRALLHAYVEYRRKSDEPAKPDTPDPQKD